MVTMDYGKLEERWQKAWKDAMVYEAEPDERKALLVTAAWPYVNSPLHIGHFRTYGTADAYSRYMRMRGYNVLFPMGFHKTGTPILAIAKRVADKDRDLINDLANVYFIDKADIERMTDPMFIADYFSKEIESSFRKAGLSIDWRRKFDSIDPLFSKMVEWQFGKLKEKGFLIQGPHPVGWCPNEGNAVGQHDTKHDVQPEIERVVAVKFKDRDNDVYFPCVTYRPETIYGTTNLFVNSSAKYIEAEVKGIHYYLSKDAAERLSNQFKITFVREVAGAELLSKKAVNPITNDEVPILAGFFVKPEFGTGIVMSVPAHAPFDYVALKRLELAGAEVPKEPYLKVIGLPNGAKQDDLPSLVYLGVFNWSEGSNDRAIEEATKRLYKEEARAGTMLVGDYKGLSEAEARGKITNDLENAGKALHLYVIANDEPVFCRCGTAVVVKIVEDQWFINYGNKDWKALAVKQLSAMKLFPEKLRHTYETTVSWIDARAAERAQGLGTRFPQNREHMIESLSDSTIYMAFYTIYDLLKGTHAVPENMKPAFFDYVFLSEGDPSEVSAATGLSEPLLKRCRESFEYWYGFTSRHSGSDLVYNHLTMYVFNHVAIFPERFWPKQIVTNGVVMMDGEKMSKSIGNIVPLSRALAKYGSDPVKMAVVASADLDADTDFGENAIKGIDSRIEFLFSEVTGMELSRGSELKGIDFWLYSKLNSKIASATRYMDAIMLKGAYNEIFYASVNELKYYHERGGSNRMALNDYLSKVSQMLFPVMPHTAEELWHALGNETLLAKGQWPAADGDMVNEMIEGSEKLISETLQDAVSAIELSRKIPANAGKKVVGIKIIIANQWKFDAYNLLVEKKSISGVIDQIGSTDKEKLAKYLSQFKNPKILVEKVRFGQDTAFKAFVESVQYLSSKLGAPVTIEKEATSSSQRAQRAVPMKPSLEVVWGA